MASAPPGSGPLAPRAEPTAPEPPTQTTQLERLARAVQRRLETFYRLGELPPVADFLRPTQPGAREAVYVRCAEHGDIEIAVLSPEPAGPADLDGHCQLIEAVSHFVFVVERARRQLPVTQLELELQAEVDKFVVLALTNERFERARAFSLHARLYDDERVRYCDPEGTEPGERYRLANGLAARYVHRLSVEYALRGRFDRLRDELVQFYGAGQSEKVGRARAA